MSILVSHLQQLSGFRCPFGHRQKGSLSIDINLSEYGVQLGPTTRTIPFSAAHSERLKGRSQHHGMGLTMTSRKHLCRGKDPTFITDSDLCIRNVRELRFHSLSENLQRKVS